MFKKSIVALAVIVSFSAMAFLILNVIVQVRTSTPRLAVVSESESLTKNVKRQPITAVLPNKIFAQISPPSYQPSNYTTNNTYYIAPNGSDSGDGSITSPWATLALGLKNLTAGDSLKLRAGTYSLDDGLILKTSGTQLAPIIVENFPGEKAIINADGIPKKWGMDTLQIIGNYVDVRGIEFANSSGNGIQVNGKHIHIINNVIHDNMEAGVMVSFPAGKLTTADVTVEGNKIFQSSLRHAIDKNAYLTGKKSDKIEGGWTAGITVNNAQGVIISNNTVSETYGEGIICYLVDQCQMRGNTVYDNYSVGLYYDNVTNSTMERNLVYSTGNQEFYQAGQPGDGIALANEDYTKKGARNANDINLVFNDRVINNIVVNEGFDFLYGSYELGGGLRNVTVANNTFYGAGKALVLLEKDKGHLNSSFVNNIFYQTAGQSRVIPFSDGGDFEPIPAVAFNHNLWFGGKQAGTGVSGTGDINDQDPRLQKAGGLAAANYKVAVDSPARNAGTPLNSVTKDYFGAERPAGLTPDIGAHQFGRSFFLSTTGADANDGSSNSPWQTLQNATSKMLPGDTLLVRDGTYVGAHVITASGSAKAPLNIMAFPGENPVFTHPNDRGDSYGDTLSILGSYLNIRGLKITSGRTDSANGLWVDVAAHHVTISNCEIYGTHAVLAVISGNNNTFESNRLHDNLTPATADWGVGLYVEGHHNIVRSNTIFNIWSHGIEFYNSYEGTQGYSAVNGNNIIDSNYIYHTGFGSVQIDKSPLPIAGLFISRSHVHNTIRNNRLCDNAQYGLYLDDQKDNTVTGNVTCYNAKGGLAVSSDAPRLINNLNNNISYNDRGTALTAISGTKIDYNTYYAPASKLSWQWNDLAPSVNLEDFRENTREVDKGPRQEEHSQVADPQFSNLPSDAFDSQQAEGYSFCTTLNQSWCKS